VPFYSQPLFSYYGAPMRKHSMIEPTDLAAFVDLPLIASWAGRGMNRPICLTNLMLNRPGRVYRTMVFA
jgi:hypothetical protein